MMALASVTLALPFEGRWLVQNSPARRVPSHGVDVLGQRYAIDFVAVDDRDRTADRRDWRTVVATEPASRFVAFGMPILAPVDGVVIAVHDGEPDHDARRSQLALVGYIAGQSARLRAGPAAVAGNHVILRDGRSGACVALVHLRAGSLRVRIGDRVTTGAVLAECGNSGNSTQPHVHVQAMDSDDLRSARGVPIRFSRYRQWHRGGRDIRDVDAGIPEDGAIVASLAPRA
ncbi:M23 family metallopeptidase [Microbacterium sp. zg.Y625]|uniref:M23 family metallopeptidase n=1 Tax=Microbacterium jiangjiandongii TaxID=3049071 RepID=UPI00214B8175|nr:MULTISPECIES: M23 family metallopeptidase [unclassified Microbacterium]MCR2792424.1 M23 family metallopeptidase [Microbacterium sp. zg.Y625]WIM26419.1 M23 family metallopeptidase [Microbacterium sp. zg-Y625]